MRPKCSPARGHRHALPLLRFKAIVEKLESGLTIQRVWQDLVEEYGYGNSYESVKRYTRGLQKIGQVVGVFHSAPGEEGQVDFFRGAPTLKPETGQ